MRKGMKKTQSIRRNILNACNYEGEISRGRGRVSFFGVKCIVDIKDTLIIINVNGGSIKVFGDGLRVSLYENRIAEIFGKIDRIEMQ